MHESPIQPANIEDRLTHLKRKLLENNGLVSEKMGCFFEGKPKFMIFLSFCDGISRSIVCKGMGNSIETAWKAAADLAKRKAKSLQLDVIWIKADIVSDITEYTYTAFLDYAARTKTNYFREGIAFDSMFNTAFLEQEINANVMFNKAKDSPSNLFNWKNINFYIKNHQGKKHSIDGGSIKKIYTFRTKGYFHDGFLCHPLHSNWLDNGRRVETISSELIYSIIDKASNYLADQVQLTGKFRYGYFPCFNREIETYNILRHASTTYSMIEAYEVVKRPKLERAIKSALNYLVSAGIELVEDAGGEPKAFVVERVAGNEIKLGANAAALLALSEYTRVFGDNRYLPVMESLAAGIAYFLDGQDGSFVHVLNFPDLSVKDKHRIIYYDGEAAFALARFYAITGDERWLSMVEHIFEHFIREEYWRHRDHWLSYCSYELVKHRPEQKYVDFNLQNAQGILDFCLTRETTYPTLLELLMATNGMIDRLSADDRFTGWVSGFDREKLLRAIEHRARHQLNGFFFPEVAMYYKSPGNILWSFYIRHHSFRVRIDDVEHNLSGYCSYYRQRLQGHEADR